MDNKMAKTALPIKVLMVMHNSTITGPNMATLSLLKAIDRSSCRIDVASPAEGYFVEQLKEMGVTHIPLEFGRYKNKIILADEISPDTCRLWDAKTKEKLDKDRFRRDLGNIEEAYQEVLRRVME